MEANRQGEWVTHPCRLPLQLRGHAFTSLRPRHPFPPAGMSKRFLSKQTINH